MYLSWMCFFVILEVGYGQFEIPPVTLEAYSPSGLRVTIPALPGIKMFAFHGKINQNFKQIEPGEFTEDIKKPRNNVFTYYNPNLRIKVGDVVNYWVFVQHEDLGYRLDNQQWNVTELKNDRPTCQSETIVIGQTNICNNALIFEDEFDGNSLDTEKWLMEQYIPTLPDFEFNIYNKESSIISLQDDQLMIRPKVRTEDLYQDWLDLTDGCTQPESRRAKCRNKLYSIHHPIASGKIVSTTNFSYAEVEVRAQLPSGDWMYPQIYLEDENYKKIVIAYARGNSVLRGSDNADIGGSLLYGGPVINTKEPSSKSYKNSKPLSDDFHTYRIKWTPQQIELFLDEDRYGLIDKETLESTGFGKDAPKVRLVLGVGVGGITDFPENVQANYPKPWINRERLQMGKFYESRDKWLPSWNVGGVLKVEYVRINAI